ncbi:MAG: 1,4-dihydroxy-2-naphthoate octaprenyltransferase [Bacteroidales bacterium]|nr:1,4-dihydroxy-2-naphthoate octaprenyltransferase [Bacteroidales bacterium]
MKTIKLNSPQAWIKAARPVTLTGALIPVMLATALAHHNGCMQTKVAIFCALFACGMQIVANLVNDIYDYLKGTDREDRLGPPRACAQGWVLPCTMNLAIFFSVLVCIIFGFGILACSIEHLLWGGFELILLGIMCVIFSFLYTTKLSYLGLGDVLVLLFFGIVPVAGTYYTQAVFSSEATQVSGILDLFPSEMWLLALISGIAIDALLVVNNFRDREQDRISGKKTPIARFGAWVAYVQHFAITLVTTILIFKIGEQLAIEQSWGASLASNLYASLNIAILIAMWRINKGRKLNALLGATSLTMTLMAVLLSIAIW